MHGVAVAFFAIGGCFYFGWLFVLLYYYEKRFNRKLVHLYLPFALLVSFVVTLLLLVADMITLKFDYDLLPGNAFYIVEALSLTTALLMSIIM